MSRCQSVLAASQFSLPAKQWRWTHRVLELDAYRKLAPLVCAGHIAA
jgi:hypothetical protein